MNSLILEPSTSKNSIYTDEDLSLLDMTRIPQHVAIMMDGNRRWAKKQGLPAIMGHWHGADILPKIVRAASALGIKALTVYSFSTENWSRTSQEIDALMLLIKTYLAREEAAMVQEGVRLDTIGDLSRLPQDVQEAIDVCKKATENGREIDLVLAMNYGSRDEIRRAVLNVIDDVSSGKICKSDLSEMRFAKYLDTAKWEDPQLLIRTSGEHRLSNFLLWQVSYSEVYITDVLWPDFSEKDLLHAILEYQRRERRLGG